VHVATQKNIYVHSLWEYHRSGNSRVEKFHVIKFQSNLISKITTAYHHNLTQKCFYPVHDKNVAVRPSVLDTVKPNNNNNNNNKNLANIAAIYPAYYMCHSPANIASYSKVPDAHGS